MTEPEQPADVVPVMAEVVAGQQQPGTPRDREPLPRGLGLLVLGIVCAVLAAAVVILLIHSGHADTQRRELACQVQRLGGEPIGGVKCPKPKSTPTPTLAPQVIVPTIVVIPPSPGQTVIVRPPPGSTPRSAATRAPTTPPARPSARPTARPTRTPRPTCSPLPIVGCLP